MTSQDLLYTIKQWLDAEDVECITPVFDMPKERYQDGAIALFAYQGKVFRVRVDSDIKITSHIMASKVRRVG